VETVPTPEKISYLNHYFKKIPVLPAKKPCITEALENAQKPDNRVACPGLRRSPDNRYSLKIKEFPREAEKRPVFPEKQRRSLHRCRRSVTGEHPGFGILKQAGIDVEDFKLGFR